MDNKSFQADIDNMKLILQECSKDLQAISKGNDDIIAALNVLSENISQYAGKQHQPKAVTVQTDTKPIEAILQKEVENIKLAVDGQPKSVVRKFQILLFPEQDAKLFYKVVFGRWLILLTTMLFLVKVYKFGGHWSDNWKEVKVQQLEDDRIKKAWNYLYHNQGKNTRRLMDSAYIKSNQKERTQANHSQIDKRPVSKTLYYRP